MREIEGYAILSNSDSFPEFWVQEILTTEGMISYSKKEKTKICKSMAFDRLKELKKKRWYLDKWKIVKIKVNLGNKVKR